MRPSTIFISLFLCFYLQGCSTAKPPPQCVGEMRPLNGIQLSGADYNHACLNVPQQEQNT